MTSTRRRFLGIPVGLAAITTALVAGATGAGAPSLVGAPPFAVGHRLSLDDSAPVMQPVHTAAGIQLVAARPGPAGTAGQEAWAYGHADAPDSGTAGGHAVFEHHTPSGWVVSGPPVLENGTPFDAERAQGISIAPNGEGWAVLTSPKGAGTNDYFVFVHHLPGDGGVWRIDRSSSDTLEVLLRDTDKADSVSLSIGSNGGGTYGFALLAARRQPADTTPGAFLILGPGTGGHWSIDSGDGTDSQGEPANAGGESAGSAVSVAVDPSSGDAWAVGSPYAVHLDSCGTGGFLDLFAACVREASAVASQQPGSVVYHRPAGGPWHAVPMSSLQSRTSFSGIASAAGVATDGTGGAWITGDTGSTLPVEGQTDPTSATNAPPAPFVLHLSSGEQPAGEYCASSCTGRFPLSDGDASLLVSTEPSGGDGGDIFLSGAAPSVLYHLHLPDTGSGFQQVPLTVGPVTSLAMFSATEGWVAARSTPTDTPVLGHLTRNPEAPQVRRWPSTAAGQFAAVAEDPAGSGVVMAAGPAGIWRLNPSTGLWSAMPLPPGSDMPRSISWPAPRFAVAAGGRTILQFDGTAWHRAGVDGGVGGDLNAVAAMAAPLPPAPAAAPTSGTTPTASSTGINQLVAWGGNAIGQLGLGTTANAHAPAAVPQLGSTVLAVSGGGVPCLGCAPSAAHTLAIACPCNAAHTAGTVYAWGSDDVGQAAVAPASAPSQCLPSPSTPAQPCLPQPTAVHIAASGGSDDMFVAVAAGARFSLALDADHHVWAWGSDSSGQLGDPPAYASLSKWSATPTEVLLPDHSTPLQAGAIAAGGETAMAIDAGTGSLWQWGLTASGPALSPAVLSGLSGVTKVAAGPSFGMALADCQSGDDQAPVNTCEKSGKELFAWGRQATGSFQTQCNATSGVNPTGWCPPMPLMNQQDTTGHPLDVSAISAGNPFSDGAGHNLGTVAVSGGRVWDVSGDNGRGLGLPNGAAYPIPGLDSVVAVAAGGSFTLAQELDGSLWVLGNNEEGQLGRDPQAVAAALTTPLRIEGVTSHGLIAAGADQALSFADAFTTLATPGGPGAGTGPSGPVGGGRAQAWAVGDGGTAVRFDGRRWSVQPSPVQLDLDSVTATGHDFVAGGHGGAILVDTGSGWVRAQTPASLGHVDAGQSEPTYPRLYAAAGLSDGTVLLGGQYGALLRRDPGDAPTSFHAVTPAVNGTVHALALRRDSHGRLRMLVSSGWLPDGTQTGGPTTAALDYSGWLMSGGDGLQWRDAELSHVAVFEAALTARTQGYDELPVQRDAVQGVLLDPSGLSGWAVGNDASTWRIAVNTTDPGLADYHPDGPPASPMAGAAALADDPGAIGSFAFTANLGCVQGDCADMLGWGSRGDVVSLESLRAIDRAARGGTLGLLVSGGDLRRIGDDALGAMPGLLDSLSIPAYAAIGAKDLNPAAAGGTCAGGGNGNAAWRAAFGNRAKPWGTGGGLPSSVSVVAVPGAATQTCGGANTHYAFDWHAPHGVIRFVVLDTSQGPSGDADPTNQSPQESEITWLTGVLGLPGSPPTVVVMNQPVLCTNASAYDAALDNVLSLAPDATDVVGVLASAQPGNFRCDLTRRIPFYMFGGGGGAFETSQRVSGFTALDPQHGDYFSWQAASVDSDPATGAPRLQVRSIPVLESVALAAPQGTVASRGSPIRFSGAGRIPDMGRVDQGEVPYRAYTPARIDFPFAAAPDAGGSVVRPDYRFSSDDDAIAAPVKPDPGNPSRPALDRSGHTSLDPQSGLFCAFKPGSTTIHLTAGTVTARLPVTVTSGSGTLCGPLAALPRPPAVVANVSLPVQPRPAPPGPGAAPLPRPHVVRPQAPDTAVGIPLPPPAGVVPAPPGGMGQGAGQKEKEEESEAATEDARMTALLPRREGSDSASWLPLGAAAAGTALAGYCLARGRRRRARPVRAAVVTLGGSPTMRRGRERG